MGSQCRLICLHSASPPTLSEPLTYLRYLLTPYTEREKAGIAYRSKVEREGRAYFIQQATKPQTLAYSLADSPVGLLGWIYEKLIAWTDAYAWTDDEGWICDIRLPQVNTD